MRSEFLAIGLLRNKSKTCFEFVFANIFEITSSLQIFFLKGKIIYVVRGRSVIRWGARLEFAAEVRSGDFVYFAPHVPHQELNLSASETVDFVVVRSDNERIVVNLDVAPAEQPETVF